MTYKHIKGQFQSIYATEKKITLIVGDENAQSTCLRSYKISMSPSAHNEISFIYGIESEQRDSQLIMLPSSIRLVLKSRNL